MNREHIRAEGNHTRHLAGFLPRPPVHRAAEGFAAAARVHRRKLGVAPPGLTKGTVKSVIHPLADILEAGNVYDIARLISEINRTLVLVLLGVDEWLKEQRE